MWIALFLFKKHGIASVLIMAPFYMLRKANGQKGAVILTVVHIVLQITAICSEATNLVCGDLVISTLVLCERASFLDEDPGKLYTVISAHNDQVVPAWHFEIAGGHELATVGHQPEDTNNHFDFEILIQV
ncbi:hypothetical protein BC830DRAFT_1168869 [Chytriomyces sp. MP71]|nr:hypothetical protein BC830DRAFT_1168869 [Chytriomyces sp. MP71]